MSAPRPAFTALSLSLAAVTVGLPIPGLRKLVVEEFGGGAHAASLFAGLHVVGTLIGAGLWGRWIRRRPPEPAALRRLVVAAFGTSSLLLLMMSVVHQFQALLVLRLLDGVAHIAIVMVLMGVGAYGEEAARSARMSFLGAFLVLGIGAGLGLGGLLALDGSRVPFIVAGVTALVGGAVTMFALPASWQPENRVAAITSVSTARLGLGVIGAMALVFAERLSMGTLTVALPFAARGERARSIGMALALFMTTSVVVMPVVRRIARRVAIVAHVAAIGLALLLLAAAYPTTLTGIGLVVWALAAGAAAGAMFMSGLLEIAARAETSVRIRALGVVHAAGGLGHAIGVFACGGLLSIGAEGPGVIGTYSSGDVTALLGGGGVLIGWAVFLWCGRSASSHAN